MCGEPGDLRLLSRELVAGLGRAFVRSLARGHQFATGPLAEPFGADSGEQIVSGSQVLARVVTSALAAQPFT
ncbi:hypothetical protein FHX44_11824 [Pseudonocardia hierapolitana]|uniref:Uncharacterized protein n=1 Tax=Pseudonocardia hierapolitana TaxID=1128676 RepID=A0A561SJ88_9PSEU|nr:hypothetical protein FHX44_11824 [Pseudonocardia hierapolitana]